MIGLDCLFAHPGMVVGQETDAWTFLESLPPARCPCSSLATAISRASSEGGPRRLRLASGVELLDLGGKSSPSNLLLYRSRRAETKTAVPLTWVSWGLARPTVNLFLGPALARASTALLGAREDDIQEILASREFSSRRIELDVRVGHVMNRMRYRIYADTPVREIQLLMLRRGLATVPVVGAAHEMLGIVSIQDVLPHVLPSRDSRSGGVGKPLTARAIMTRAVFCVAEDEGLLDASWSMVTRSVSSLPVVRGGELIGFLSRRTVMRAFADAVVRDTPDGLA